MVFDVYWHSDSVLCHAVWDIFVIDITSKEGIIMDSSARNLLQWVNGQPVEGFKGYWRVGGPDTNNLTLSHKVGGLSTFETLSDRY